MENNSNRSLIWKRALYVYLGVCILVVFIILWDSFKGSRDGGLQGQLYVKPNIVLDSGK
jgi:hypothetical protein